MNSRATTSQWNYGNELQERCGGMVSVSAATCIEIRRRHDNHCNSITISPTASQALRLALCYVVRILTSYCSIFYLLNPSSRLFLTLKLFWIPFFSHLEALLPFIIILLFLLHVLALNQTTFAVP